MKTITPAYFFFFVGILTGCTSIPKQHHEIDYEIFLTPAQNTPTLPALQSCAFAQTQTHWVLIGGRKDGFHGRKANPKPFPFLLANDTVWVIDTQDWSCKGASVQTFTDPYPFQATNMAHWQSGDTLFLLGGYGFFPKDTTQEARYSNHTFDSFHALSISQLIKAIDQGEALQTAVLFSLRDPFFKVTGGELVKVNNYFYLVFGQDYSGEYRAGKDGLYTEAVRKFSLQNQQITNKKIISSSIDPKTEENPFHRRDLNVALIRYRDTTAITAFGGVFRKNGDGWTNPITIQPMKQDQIAYTTFEQRTNHYTCAQLLLYSAKNRRSVTNLLGGIGQYQYHPETQTWENGDQGNKLPFVKSITQLTYDGITWRQKIQKEELPAYLGTNAVFIPQSAYRYDEVFLDYDKIPAQKNTHIGYLYGGILAQRPSSSSEFPTQTNFNLYEVWIKK
ncbi:MAG: hypothetical protein ACFCUI_10690 [Bernardetiaceae bacterium]